MDIKATDNLIPTIGLEIHAELKTHTKMFCDCLNDPFEKHPNINICPICTGHPGTLPTINKEAVRHLLKVGLALKGKIFPKKQAKFDRKNYFYPDLPKGYQISQYDQPLVEGGELLGVRIRRIHLEEDTASLVHKDNYSLIDFNRAGVPLMELVTEPDIKNAAAAAAFAKKLRLILRYLNVSDADMEKGHLRLEANVSLNMGTKVEIKNINSFKVLEEAINYEIERQKDLINKGKKVKQETRGWNDAKKKTVSQRSKEEAQDYRYFPEPDLPPLNSSAFRITDIKKEIPELPDDKKKRFIKEYGLEEKQISLLVQNPAAADYFEQAASELPNKEHLPLLYNYFTTDLWGLLKKQGLELSAVNIKPKDLAHLAELAGSKKITSRIAKDLLAEMLKTGLDPHQILSNNEWQQIKSENLEKIAQDTIQQHPQAVADYKKGKTAALQFLIGQVMFKVGGKADPNDLRQILKTLLDEK